MNPRENRDHPQPLPWRLGLIALQVALAILLLAAAMAPMSAPASAPAPATAAAEFEFDEELEGEEESEEECLEFLDPEEIEELCGEDEGEDEPEATSAARCPLRSASAHATVRHKRLKVTIGYTTYEPTIAKIQIRKVGTFKRHLGHSGVLRFTKKVGKRRPKKLMVQIKPTGGSDCAPRRLMLFPY